MCPASQIPVNKSRDAGLPDNLPGFDEPLALLRACHTRILDHCELLEQLVTKVKAQGDETEIRDTARKLITYFSNSARLHHRDEENDLFPRLAVVLATESSLPGVTTPVQLIDLSITIVVPAIADFVGGLTLTLAITELADS